MNVELKRIAEKKLEQLGGDVCGVLVRKDGGVMAVSEHGRCTRLDAGVMGPVSNVPASDRDEFEKWFSDNHVRAGETVNLQMKAYMWVGFQAARAQSGQEEDGKGSLPWFVHVYNSGYEAGHHDTVEGGFTPIHPSDQDTYHEELVLEILEDLNVQASRDPKPAQQGSVPEVFMRLFEHARGLSFGHDWNKGTAQSYHRKPLLESVEECKRYLATPQPVGDEWIPEGWKLVPIEPTPDMRRAFHKAHELFENGEEVDGSPDDEWRAMLAAAPQPPKQEGE